MFRLLSHPLAPDTPTPGARLPLELVPDEMVARGDPGNTAYVRFWNHAGTHLDAPAHMLPDGTAVWQLEASDLVFERPLVLDVPKDDNELVTESDLVAHAHALSRCDLLLLRTGHHRWRLADPVRFRDRNPGLSAAAARYLVRPEFSGLRAVGIDAISIAANAHLPEGIEAHRILFSATRPRPLLIVEDLDLHSDLANLSWVIVAPFVAAGLDSSPCTVIAQLGLHE